MSETIHSPLPWKGEGDSIILSSFEPDQEGDLVAGAIAEVRRTFAETPKPLDDRRRRANRDLILRAVNAHADLLAVCELEEEWYHHTIASKVFASKYGIDLRMTTVEAWLRDKRLAAIKKAKGGIGFGEPT